MLDRRAQILLKTLVERYIAEGEPVGSRVLSRYSGLELSPATIRNVMADLEELGFIASPHTSAGRIPTPRGYRVFVDTLLKVRMLDATEIRRLEGELGAAPDPQQLLDASELKDRLADAISALPEREKLVIALYYYENLTLREIGEVLGVTESRISQLHTKAVLRLKSRLQGDNLRD